MDRVILAVHISAKFDRMDRFEIIEKIGSMLSWFGQMFGQKDKTKGVTPWDYASFNQLVPKRGFEPRRGNPHWTLNPARLPVPPLRPMASNQPGNFERLNL
jgi:hypothetical protein